ncbi:MAG: hypothetical protein JWO06_1053, partial [Bacteroidota bacterium]|nr:hypothetical protein [Bacteroidota bacterium]
VNIKTYIVRGQVGAVLFNDMLKR